MNPYSLRSGSIPITFIQPCTRSPCQASQYKKSKTAIKGIFCLGNKNVHLFYLQMTWLCVEVPKESPELTLEVMSELRRPQDARSVYNTTCIPTYWKIRKWKILNTIIFIYCHRNHEIFKDKFNKIFAKPIHWIL